MIAKSSDLAAVRRALWSVARRQGSGVSRWLAEAAAAELRSEALAQYLDDWKPEHGKLTAAELARAAAEPGLPVAGYPAA